MEINQSNLTSINPDSRFVATAPSAHLGYLEFPAFPGCSDHLGLDIRVCSGQIVQVCRDLGVSGVWCLVSSV